ncbi:hypothetical protein FANTH_11423 [Fusarium anthophilum]|uniref:Uncharacterized protein n=1 Tax=Fusarium anthophilum TaxID=48485 RepID=A0A8H4YXL7_9HYPO|nr:hypothetical protein FANTH_11423 [Fusarium anthophilum]
MYAIIREFLFYINLRQAFLLTPQYAKRISSRTVLFTSVPKECLDEGRIRSLFSGSVKKIWIAGDTKQLDRTIQERDNVIMKLRKAEIKWIRLCNKDRIKYETKTGNEAERATTSTSDPESGNLGRKRLKGLIPEAQNAQNNWLTGDYEKHTAFFVEFSTQYDAQVAFHMATHHRHLQMSPRFIGIKPNQVIWKNLNYSWWHVAIRQYAACTAIAGLVVFWALPVTIVGIIAQVNTIKSLPGLTWIKDIPQVILGAVSGLLPSIALSILMSSVPIFIRSCAMWSGCVSLSQAELFTQKAYFIFQVLQVFLVQTLSNSFISYLVTILRNPNNVFSVLSTSIPTASNFYISFFIVQGLTIATDVLTQVFGLIMFTISSTFAEKTPRMRYHKWTTLSTISLGSLMPIYTNMAVISIIYSVIAPFLLFWSTISMDTDVDTDGLIYPQALKQLLLGVYLAEMCLVGLFIVSKAVGPAFLMIIFLALTTLCHVSLVKALDPLLYNLPLSINFEKDRMNLSQQRKTDNGQVWNAVSTIPRGASKRNTAHKLVPTTTSQDHNKADFVSGWLKSRIFVDYAAVEHLIYHEDLIEQEYSEDAEAQAYYQPSATSQTPSLWVPGDYAGISNNKVVDIRKVAPISNKGCHLNTKAGESIYIYLPASYIDVGYM